MVETTPTERALQQSLPSGIRDRPIQEVISRQTLMGGQTPAPTQTLRGGGRGRRRPRGPTPAQLASQQAARERAEKTAREQAARRAATAERIALREARKEERILAGTIGGQITAEPTVGGRGPQPGAPEIRAFVKSEFDPGRRFRRGFGESSLSFARETGGAISGLLLGRKTLKEIKDPFRAFVDVGPQRGEQEIFVPQFGTITADQPTGVERTTLFQIQEEAQIEAGGPTEVLGFSPESQALVIGQRTARRTRKKFQEKVDIGELDVEEATTRAGKEFDIEFGKRTDILQQLGGDELTKRVGETGAEFAKQALITGGITAATILSPAIAAGVGGASLGAAGGLSVKAGREFGFSREELTQSALTLGQAGLFAAGGASLIGGALGPTGKVAQSITRARIQDLQRQELGILGAEIPITSKESLTIAAKPPAPPPVNANCSTLVEITDSKGGAF